MTRRSVYLPDDIDAYLERLGSRQASAFVTEALRERIARDATRAGLAAAGYDPSPERVAAARAQLRRPTPAQQAAAYALIAAQLGESVEAVQRDLDPTGR